MGESKHQPPPPQEEAERGGGGRNAGRLSMVMDPSAVPRWCCQSCRHPLYFLGVDPNDTSLLLLTNDPSRSGLQASGIQGAGSMLSSTRMDQSYVLLPKQRNQPPGIPRPRPGANSAGAVSVVANMNKTVGTEKASRVNAKQPGSDSQSGKAMEESFVVLPSVEASIYKADSASEGGGLHSSPKQSPVSPSQANNFGFYSSISVLEQAIEIAAKQTQVDQPLCLECMRLLSEKLEEEIVDVNRDIKAYEACLLQLEGESLEVLSESDFIREKKKIDEEERRLEEAIKEIKKQYSQVSLDLKALDSKTEKFNELEENYWHEFNDFQFQLTRHQEERDAILAKIEISQVHLELLKRTNVLNDAFHIWHDGDFGTINNFRLGRLPKIPVEWDEINAAWGQACLLLHTMAQYFRPKFPYKIKILPMGSYPRVMDSSNNTYELFGPVNLFWSTRYDKAMTLYLACLKDFADFANAKDQENNVPPDKWFSLPYKIENDKVDNLTITQSFNKQENWTKALKCMVCDLKWVLYWFIGNTSFQPHPTLVPSKPDMPTTTTVTGSGKSPKPSTGGSSSRTQSKSSAN